LLLEKNEFDNPFDKINSAFGTSNEIPVKNVVITLPIFC
jgi:hypothetical protein